MTGLDPAARYADPRGDLTVLAALILGLWRNGIEPYSVEIQPSCQTSRPLKTIEMISPLVLSTESQHHKIEFQGHHLWT